MFTDFLLIKNIISLFYDFFTKREINKKLKVMCYFTAKKSIFTDTTTEIHGFHFCIFNNVQRTYNSH